MAPGESFRCGTFSRASDVAGPSKDAASRTTPCCLQAWRCRLEMMQLHGQHRVASKLGAAAWNVRSFTDNTVLLPGLAQALGTDAASQTTPCCFQAWRNRLKQTQLHGQHRAVSRLGAAAWNTRSFTVLSNRDSWQMFQANRALEKERRLWWQRRLHWMVCSRLFLTLRAFAAWRVH